MGKRFRQLTQTATDADFVDGNYFGVDTPSVTKKVPANLVAKASEQAALTTYAQNAAHSLAPEFDPTRTSENPYKAGERVMVNGVLYVFTSDHYGAWTGTDAVVVDIDSIVEDGFTHVSMLTKEIDVGVSKKGYSGGFSIAGTNTNYFRYHVVPVVANETYVVRTRLGSATVFISCADTPDATSGLTSLVHDSTGYDDYKEYEVTPTKGYLYISHILPTGDRVYPYIQFDYRVFLIKKSDYIITLKSKVTRVENATEALEIENKRKGGILKEVAIIRKVDGSYVTGSTTEGGAYIASLSNLSYFVCKVEPGKKYVVRTRLQTSTVLIAQGASDGLTDNLTQLVRNSVDPTVIQEYVISPTQPYVYISFKKDSGETDGDVYVYEYKDTKEWDVIELTADRTSPITVSKDTVIYGNGHKVNLGVDLDPTFTDGFANVNYTASEGGLVYDCFVGQTKPLEVSGTRNYYNVTIWAVDDNDVSRSKILTPYLSSSDVETNDNSFTYDGIKFIIHCSENSTYTRFVMASESGIGVYCNGHKVKVYDLRVEFTRDNGAYILNSPYSEWINCEFGYSTTLNGFRCYLCDFVRIDSCYAHNNNNDGFGIVACRQTAMTNSLGCYNQDDGVSHHGDEIPLSNFYVCGCEFHHNAKGGISSPVYGSCGAIENCLLHHNYYGVYTVRPNPNSLSRGYQTRNSVKNCLITNNQVGVRADGYELWLLNNKYANNIETKKTANDGVINDYDT